MIRTSLRAKRSNPVHQHSWIAASCAALLAMTIFSGDASAQPIRDMSLSEQDSFRVTNNRQQNSVQPLGNGLPALNMNQGDMNAVNTNPYMRPDGRTVEPVASFMDGYCDPNYRPLVNTPAMANIQACVQQSKQEACQQFKSLPADAKNALDEAIGCTYTAANNTDMEQRQTYSDISNCANMDYRRLQLMKKYWQDQQTAWALLFLPDKVLDASSQCMTGRR